MVDRPMNGGDAAMTGSTRSPSAAIRRSAACISQAWSDDEIDDCAGRLDRFL